MTDQIPTPRTDSHFIGRLKEGGRTDKRDERFARQLERELTLATTTLERLPDNVWIRATLLELKEMRRAFEEGK